MMKIKYSVAVAILLSLTSYVLPLEMSAQEQKLFTLEDLNFGGNNYRNLQPKNMWLTWWGDQLVETDVEYCRHRSASSQCARGKQQPDP